MLAHEGGDVVAADFLLALGHEHDPAGQLSAVGGAHGIHRRQAGGQLSLVVSHPAGEQHPVADGGLEGRRGPFFQRFRRLDIIMVVEQQRARGAPAEAPDDDRVAGCLELLHLQAVLGEELRHQVGALAHALAARRNTRLRAQAHRLGDVTVEVGLKVGVDRFVDWGHEGLFQSVSRLVFGFTVAIQVIGKCFA